MSLFMSSIVISSGGQVQEIADTFGVDWPHLIAQIISFSIVCFLLHRFAYKPVLHMLEERRRQIAEGIAERERIRAELAQAENQRHGIIMQAEAQAGELIEEAQAAAARVREKETLKAIAAAEQILVKSRETALQDRNRMFEELKRELGTLVIEATEKLTKKILTPADQKRMVEETITGLQKVA